MIRPIRAIGEYPFQSILGAIVVVSSVALLATPYYALAVLPGLGLLLLLLLIRRPAFGYYLIVALFPFGAYRGLSGPYGAVKFHWILAIVLLAGVVLQHVREKRLNRRLSSNLWPLFATFATVSLVSALLSPTPRIALEDVLLLLAGFLFVFLSQLFISRRGFISTLPSVIIWSISAGSLLAVLGHFFGVLVRHGAPLSQGLMRSAGGTTDPNHLALLVVFAIPFLVHRFLNAKHTVARSVAAVLLLLNLAAMVATFSRGGALGLVGVTLCLLLEHRNRLKPVHLGFVPAAAALALVLAATLVPREYWERQRSLTSSADTSISRRKTYFLVAWDAARRRPLLGSGLGTFPRIYARSKYAAIFAREGDRRSVYRDAHNTYLQVAVETGVLGLVPFLAILALTWRSFSRARAAASEAGNDEMLLLVGAYRTAFAGLLLYLLIISNLLNKYLLLCFAVSQVALRVTASRQDTPNDEVVPAC